ncbi:MAG: DUF86 domain-containing protein [Planctomycetes bacterium]|nr:DUF86 domain-containing protein [Planctomycetota bacterium]
MQRDATYLADILDSARLAISYLAGVEYPRFAADVQLQDSVIRRLEIIGEAARRCSDETQCLWPDLPWRDMIGMRNVMIHQYDSVDLSIVWRTVQHNLPELVRDLERILEPEKGTEGPLAGAEGRA